MVHATSSSGGRTRATLHRAGHARLGTSLPSRSPTARLPGAYGEKSYCEPASSAAIQYASCDTWARESSTWQVTSVLQRAVDATSDRGAAACVGARAHASMARVPYDPTCCARQIIITNHRLDYRSPCHPTCCARRPRRCPRAPRGCVPAVIALVAVVPQKLHHRARQIGGLGNVVRACRVLSTAKSDDSMRCAA